MSSTERRDFLVGPKAVEHCDAKTVRLGDGEELG